MAYKNVEDRRKANAKFQSEHTTVITMKLVDTSDADILRHLGNQSNKQGYIKSLIRADIARQKAFDTAKRTAAEAVFTGTDYDPVTMINDTAEADSAIKSLISEEKLIEFWTSFFKDKLADLEK